MALEHTIQQRKQEIGKEAPGRLRGVGFFEGQVVAKANANGAWIEKDARGHVRCNDLISRVSAHHFSCAYGTGAPNLSSTARS
jgi:hypothetical protein